jgi:hypothetical protein
VPKVLYGSIIRVWQQPSDHISLAFERLFFERAAQCLTGTLLLVVLKAHPVPPTRVGARDRSRYPVP